MVWERTTRRVLTLSDATAITIDDVAGLRSAGIDPSEVAAAFADVMLEQFFRFGYFHADPHPGNIFVAPVAGSRSGEAARPAWRFAFIRHGRAG